MLYFVWRFLAEARRIQEKMKGMKSFGDIIDATNQALDEFNEAFEDAGKVIEKKKEQLRKLIAEADESVKRLEAAIDNHPKAMVRENVRIEFPPPPVNDPGLPEPGEAERVEFIKRYLGQGKSHEEISRLTGASIREISLVEKFSASR